MDSIILKPKVNGKGQPINPEELPALRIYQRYNRYLRLGRTDEEAAELALRVPGGPCIVCKKKPSVVNSTKGLCGECGTANRIKKSRERAKLQTERLKKNRPAAAICLCGCGLECRSGASYAKKEHRDQHEKAQRQAHRQPRAYSRPEQSRKMNSVPKADRKVEVISPKPEPVNVAGVEVKKVSNLYCRPTLRNFFGDENGKEWSAVD